MRFPRRGIAATTALFLIPALGVGTSAAAENSFPAPAYPSADCTPVAGLLKIGLAPQQWNASVGLPLSVSGTPAAQRIVIGEIDETANVNAVNLLLQQCGLDPITLITHVNSGAAGSATAGLESTLDITVVAAALPANATMTLVNSPASAGLYGVFVNMAEACGLQFAGNPWTGLRTLSPGVNYPVGGCVISLSYGGSESNVGTTATTDTDFVLDQLAANGVVVVASAGDEGSGGCVSNAGLNFGNATILSVPTFEATSNLATLTTSTVHGFTVDQNVFLGKLSPDYDGMYRILTTPTTTTFTVAMVTPDQSSIAINGVASVNFGGLEPQYPAVNPNVLAVGGVQWDPQSLSLRDGLSIDYVPGSTVRNNVWRDVMANPNCANLANYSTTGGQGTGGGQSSNYVMPAYQQVLASGSYPAAPARRMMPDLAALAGWPTFALANFGVTVGAAQLKSNVATLYTPSALGINVGELVSVDLLPAPFTSLNGVSLTVTAVTTTTISFALAGVDIPGAYVAVGNVSQTCSAPCSNTAFPWYPVVGTSAATPLTAVGIAQVNAVLSARGLARITNDGGSMDIHSVVYDTGNSTAFTDVTDGNNDIHSFGGYSALTGFDMATGMGVPNFTTLSNLLITRLTPAEGGGSSAPSVTSPAQVGDPVQLIPIVVPEPPKSVQPASVLTYLGSGVRISTGPNTATTKRTIVSRSAARTLRNAPRVRVPANAWRVPILRVSGEARPFSSQMRVKGIWESIGIVESNDRGKVVLASLRLSRSGKYPVRLIDSEGRTFFVKIRVKG